MKLTIALIRGGLTGSGEVGTLSGVAEEKLLQKSVDELKQRVLDGVYPAAELVYTSQAACCFETAKLIYPHVPAMVTTGLESHNYGIYNGMTARRMKEDKQFADWAASAGVSAFPGGESYYALSARSNRAFHKIINGMLGAGVAVAGVVTHRLVISAILQKIYAPRHSYADWRVKNGGGYIIKYDNETHVGVLKEFF